MTFDYKARTPEENAAVDRRANASRYRRVKAQRDDAMARLDQAADTIVRLNAHANSLAQEIERLRRANADLVQENSRAWGMLRDASHGSPL